MNLRGLRARSAEALQQEYPPVRARFAALELKAALPAAGPATPARRQRVPAPCYRPMRAMLERERAPGQSRCSALPERLTAPVHRQVQRGQSAGAWQRNPRMPALPEESAVLVSMAVPPVAGPAMRGPVLVSCSRSLAALQEQMPPESCCPALPVRSAAPAHRQALRARSVAVWQRNPQMRPGSR